MIFFENALQDVREYGNSEGFFQASNSSTNVACQTQPTNCLYVEIQPGMRCTYDLCPRLFETSLT